MKKISIQEAFDFNIEPKESKEETAICFIMGLRQYLLDKKIAKIGDIFPSKQELAKFLKMGTGTIQNAIKHIEDEGFFASKQRVGTIISDKNSLPALKMFAKKDKALIELKKYLILNGFEIGEFLPPASYLAQEIKTSIDTIRFALRKLTRAGFLKKEIYNNKPILILCKIPELKEAERGGISIIKNKNLVKILKEDIKKYLNQNFKSGDKIPTNIFFAKKYKTSVRTINMCMKELSSEKFIFIKRGNYGSILLGRDEEEKNKISKNFSGYKWEKALIEIRNYILKNAETGDKIPSIKEFAVRLNSSTTTIKKAIEKLKKEGILYPQKGKYGGLFVCEMPEVEDSYRWLALNPKYFSS